MNINQILNPIKHELNKESAMEAFCSEYDENDELALAMEAIIDKPEMDEGIDSDLDEDEDMTTDEYIENLDKDEIDVGIDSDLDEDDDILTDEFVDSINDDSELDEDDSIDEFEDDDTLDL